MVSRMAPYMWLFLALAVIAGCRSAYYDTLEKIGIHKRDLMVSRVEGARDAQEEAKQQFQSALEQFSAVVAVSGGDLEQKYEKLVHVYRRSEEKAEEVYQRIRSVEEVSEALFNEWEDELDQYASRRLREDSRRKLATTRKDYARLMQAMKRAEKKIEPVLAAFHDQVLYLKHNLNARAISSLRNELVVMETNVSGLVNEMEDSIREAEQFLATLRSEG